VDQRAKRERWLVIIKFIGTFFSKQKLYDKIVFPPFFSLDFADMLNIKFPHKTFRNRCDVIWKQLIFYSLADFAATLLVYF